MLAKLGISLLCSVVLLANGCGSKSEGNKNTGQVNAPQAASASPSNPEGAKPEVKPAPATSLAASNGPASSARPDACGLIEKSEIESVQGGKVQGTLPSRRDGGALAISQCYYTIFSSDGSKDLSVHLEVMQNDPKSPNQNAVGDLWKRFQGAKGTKKMEKPKSVPGVGDEAYWVGNNKGGALYALKRDRLVRVSIGGPDDEAAKIAKSKTLAEKALKRLS